MKREYQEMINKYVDAYNSADTVEKKKEAAVELEITKLVIDALLFNAAEMELLG